MADEANIHRTPASSGMHFRFFTWPFKPLAGILFAWVAMVSGQLPAVAQETDNDTYSARGLLTAPMRVELKTLLEAPIDELPYRPGDRFETGALLVGFDCSRYEAEEKAAKAGANAAWIDYQSKKRLLSHGAVGKDEVSLAGARANQASAEARVREVINADCRLEAPFSGRVVTVNARPHEHPARGEPLITIVGDGALEVELIVPSFWLSWLMPGAAFVFQVEETGIGVSGNLTRIAPEIDAVSQTVRVFGEIEAVNGHSLLPGMSGTAIFDGERSG